MNSRHTSGRRKKKVNKDGEGEKSRSRNACVCVQMRAFRVAVMASGGCAFSRESHDRVL